MRRRRRTARPVPAVVRVTRIGFPEPGFRIAVLDRSIPDRVFGPDEAIEASSAANEIARSIRGRVEGLPL